jgi:mono/diheme cytochrome c family protein
MSKFAPLAIATVALMGCAAALAQDKAPPPGPPPQPAQAGPPPMPKPLTLADRPNATGGEKLYIVKCAMCHGPNGMGQGLLAREGKQPDLEKRGDLKKPYIVFAARHGIGNMPAIPPGEVSDKDLAAIADYLAAGPHGDAK